MNMSPQCPNCGGYNTRQERDLFVHLNPLVTILVFLFSWTIIVPILWYYGLAQTRRISEFSYVCNLCGYQWEKIPGEIIHINYDPELIKLLEEQQRKKDDQDSYYAVYWLLYNQNKKKK